MPTFGSGAKLSLTQQNSLGATAPSSWRTVPFASQDLSYTVAELTDDSIVGNSWEPDRAAGMGGVSGSFQANINPLALGHYLRGLCGASSVVAAGAAYKHTFVPTSGNWSPVSTLPPFAFQVDPNESAVNSTYLLRDCFFNTGEITVAAGGYARATWGIVGKFGGLITRAAPTDFSAANPFKWSSVSVSIGGAAVTRFHDLTVNLNNNIATQDRLDGTAQHSFFFREGFREIRFNGTIDMAQTDWLNFLNNTETAVQLTFVGASAISSGYNEQMIIDIPRFVYTAVPLGIAGPGIISTAFTGRGMYLSTSLTAVMFTLQNTVATYP